VVKVYSGTIVSTIFSKIRLVVVVKHRVIVNVKNEDITDRLRRR